MHIPESLRYRYNMKQLIYAGLFACLALPVADAATEKRAPSTKTSG